jgi:hypothetical protein
MESLFIVIYGVAFVFILYYLIQLNYATPLHYARPLPNATISVHDTNVWPWPITKHTFWEHWFDKKDGYPVPKSPGHQSGYGYSGRQKATEMKSFEGDHYGWDLDGGNYCGSGYGYTGR